MHLAKQPFADFITEQKRYIPRDYHRAGLRIGLAEGMKRRFVDGIFGLYGHAESKKTAKICLPLGITTKAERTDP
jgi:hypothetical protein